MGTSMVDSVTRRQNRESNLVMFLRVMAAGLASGLLIVGFSWLAVLVWN